MNELPKVRENILSNAAEFASAYAEVACGRGVLTCADKKVRDEYWALIKELALVDAKQTVALPHLAEGSISDRVDAVMQAVATGQIDIQQGKRLIEMLQAGFEITELKDLIAKLSAAGVEIE